MNKKAESVLIWNRFFVMAGSSSVFLFSNSIFFFEVKFWKGKMNGWPCTRESRRDFNRESLNFQHSLCLVSLWWDVTARQGHTKHFSFHLHFFFFFFSGNLLEIWILLKEAIIKSCSIILILRKLAWKLSSVQIFTKKFLSYGRILTLYYYFLLMCILFSQDYYYNSN